MATDLSMIMGTVLLCSLWELHVLSMTLESHNTMLTKLSSSSPGMRAVAGHWRGRISPECSNHA